MKNSSMMKNIKMRYCARSAAAVLLVLPCAPTAYAAPELRGNYSEIIENGSRPVSDAFADAFHALTFALSRPKVEARGAADAANFAALLRAPKSTFESFLCRIDASAVATSEQAPVATQGQDGIAPDATAEGGQDAVAADEKKDTKGTQLNDDGKESASPEKESWLRSFTTYWLMRLKNAQRHDFPATGARDTIEQAGRVWSDERARSEVYAQVENQRKQKAPQMSLSEQRKVHDMLELNQSVLHSHEYELDINEWPQERPQNLGGNSHQNQAPVSSVLSTNITPDGKRKPGDHQTQTPGFSVGNEDDDVVVQQDVHGDPTPFGPPNSSSKSQCQQSGKPGAAQESAFVGSLSNVGGSNNTNEQVPSHEQSNTNTSNCTIIYHDSSGNVVRLLPSGIFSSDSTKVGNPHASNATDVTVIKNDGETNSLMCSSMQVHNCDNNPSSYDKVENKEQSSTPPLPGRHLSEQTHTESFCWDQNGKLIDLSTMYAQPEKTPPAECQSVLSQSFTGHWYEKNRQRNVSAPPPAPVSALNNNDEEVVHEKAESMGDFINEDENGYVILGSVPNDKRSPSEMTMVIKEGCLCDQKEINGNDYDSDDYTSEEDE